MFLFIFVNATANFKVMEMHKRVIERQNVIDVGKLSTTTMMKIQLYKIL